jgi:quercetin dioxygenase-like cupin family protein
MMVDKTIVPGKAFTLNGLAEYVAGSVVSRILSRGPAGVVTLFAFDAGEEVSEHTTPCEALAVILDGAADLVVGGEPLRAVAGQMVLLPANVPHSLLAKERFKMLLVMLRS